MVRDRSRPRRRGPTLAGATIFATLAMKSAVARADDDPTLHADDPAPQPIYGGNRVMPCGWPTTVYVNDCTGTLVHPQLVIYAAHCGASVPEVFFGDAVGEPGFSIPTTTCRVHPQGTGTDWAFCTLSEPVTDIAVTPPLMGCETELLQPQMPVWIVGYGELENGAYGEKYEAQTKLYQIQDNEAFIGGDGADTCYGDSGGPAYVQVEDGTWRAFGITSYAIEEACGMGTWFSMMHTGIAWFESESGIDITPCHDPDGTWNPGPECGGFPMAPMTGVGNWAAGCDSGPVGGLSSTCGPAYGAAPDDAPPIVSIVAPNDGASFPTDDTGFASVLITVEADDGEGSGVAEVQVILDGVAFGDPDVDPPWQVEAVLDRGTHVVSATALDVDGNLGAAPEVEIEVGDGEDPDDDDDDTGGGASDGWYTSTAGENEADDASCGCAHDRRHGLLPWLLVPIALRRRRLA